MEAADTSLPTINRSTYHQLRQSLHLPVRCCNSELLSETLVRLIHPYLTDDDIDRILDVSMKFVTLHLEHGVEGDHGGNNYFVKQLW